ncbi:MAG TPA: DUF6298 domain-containing protein [Opitutaceae bacterium]|nr:DUF6298 domain-containing protein [Opitutaceae bacterium]
MQLHRQIPLLGACALAFALSASASQVKKPFVTGGRTGALVYEKDDLGNRIPDFSGAGYAGGGVALPDAPVRVLVNPGEGDAGARIQAAIDHAGSLAPDARGIRGAVLLTRGRYEIAGQLRLAASGVVLRGEGQGADGTVLVATGTDRRPLLLVAGNADRKNLTPAIAVADSYVPVGATQLRLARAEPAITPGTLVTIERPSPAEWIEQLGMHDAPGRQPYNWKPGSFNVRWDRVVSAVDGDRITLDVPLTVSLDARIGGGTVTPYTTTGLIEHAGVENLRCESAVSPGNPLDEDHAWNAIDLHAARDVWVADVTGVHFAGSLVQVGAKVARVTVQDCVSLDPVSEIGGYRRMAFHTRGQQTLFLRCVSEQGRNDFTTGYLAAGPNVFLECFARETRSFSGSMGSWASGILFDNVSIDGGALRLDNLETFNQGVGWSAANSVIYQSTASLIVSRRPPGAANWAIGPWSQFIGDGWWDQVNEFVTPESLYRAQLVARLGAPALAALQPRNYSAAAFGAPVVNASTLKLPPAPATGPGRPLALTNGWLTGGGTILAGKEGNMNFWLGRLEPARSAEQGIALTRFAPGRAGTGLTDELPSVAASMVAAGQVVLRHHYGLWYDRRRIDHERIRRPDGEVWPPFYEMPWARSGQGTAWDGLSRYDLTKFNPWYFGRLREFAGLARAKGLVLVNEMYFQHNILEAGAHWAESPWRPVNCIQETGFPEPVPYRDDDGTEPARPELGKRVFMAEAFYDVTHPVRRGLHRAYIRQCLANLADEPNVIHTLSAEYSGPRHFMEFWLDVVGEWEAETGRRPLIALSAPKDVQDAILADAKRAALVDVIDFTYWWRTDDGKEYAPAGGTKLAPRQHERLWKGGRATAASIAGMVSEYRGKFPGKAIISGLPAADGWAFAAAGGSLPQLPATTDERLLSALPKMSPVAATRTEWTLGEKGAQYFFYAAKGGALKLDLRGETGAFTVNHVDLASGKLHAAGSVTAGSIVDLPLSTPAAVWLTR